MLQSENLGINFLKFFKRKKALSENFSLYLERIKSEKPKLCLEKPLLNKKGSKGLKIRKEGKGSIL